MALAHDRAARAERRAAAALGTERVRYRAQHESAPDVRPVALPSGDVLSVEVKQRKRLPKALGLDVLEQAKRYASPGWIPVGVIAEHGGRAMVLVMLDDFAQLVGVQPSKVRAVQQPLALDVGAVR